MLTGVSFKAMIKKITGILTDEKRDKFLFVFLAAFLLQAAAFLPFVMVRGGYFVYYGDYNAQQIPFWYHVHSAVRQGNFLWDFSTDLGSDLFGSYAFYLLGSPFFWLTVPFPDSVIPYIMPWLICLKTAVAALTSYAFLREFVPNRNACFLGGLLYAFSGFQLYNIMFNHFHDPVAFFPLLLLGSEKLMRENRRGLFAAAAALCAVTNYFFFAGMAVFTVIWFAVNVITGRYKLTFKGFAVYAFEAVLGCCTAAVILLPAAAALMGNSRAGDLISPGEAFVYSDKYTYLYILKSFFTFPDLPLEAAFHVSEDLDCASAAAYLPFVSLCGVLAYIKNHRRLRSNEGMPVIMLAASVVFMLVPCLNSAFSGFNSQYYARWFFMPVLIMCLMTSAAAGEDIGGFKRFTFPVMGAAVVYIIGAAVLIKASGSGNMTNALITGVVPLGCTALLYSALSDNSLSDNSARLRSVTGKTALCCTLFTALVIGQGTMTIDRAAARNYIDNAIRSANEIDDLKSEDGGFFRVDMCENFHNYNLMWDMGSCSSFISTVSSSVSDVNSALGYPRLVTSKIPFDHAAYRSLTSVKYYFDMPIYTEEGKAASFEILGNSCEAFTLSGERAGMTVYENNCYIPMGFTYDYYTTPEDIAGIDARIYRSQALLEAVVMSDEQRERFADILAPYNIMGCGYDYERLYEIAAAKRETACRDFYTDRNGFGAVFENPGDRDKLVFFSVPYDKGWNARINGERADIERVSYGFMAVRCPPGVSEIRFDYTSKPLKYGCVISLAGAAVMALYVILTGRRKVRKP